MSTFFCTNDLSRVSRQIESPQVSRTGGLCNFKGTVIHPSLSNLWVHYSSTVNNR